MKRMNKLVSLLFLSQLSLAEYLRAEQQVHGHNSTVSGMIAALEGSEIQEASLLGTSEQATCAEDPKILIEKSKKQKSEEQELGSESESSDSESSASESEDEE